MSDEEKKAIEELKNKKADYFMISDLTSKTILNLIEKQSKEIEELRNINKKLEARKYMLNAETGEIYQIPIGNNYINKTK